MKKRNKIKRELKEAKKKSINKEYFQRLIL